MTELPDPLAKLKHANAIKPVEKPAHEVPTTEADDHEHDAELDIRAQWHVDTKVLEPNDLRVQ
jgi:hypothetical protein